jgi:hypothetical protein
MESIERERMEKEENEKRQRKEERQKTAIGRKREYGMRQNDE